MNHRHLALPVAAALALSLSACGEDAGRTSTAQAPGTSSPMPGERPGSPGNPKGMRDTSPSIPADSENRPEKPEQPFGQGSPQTSMKGAEIPEVAKPGDASKPEGQR